MAKAAVAKVADDPFALGPMTERERLAAIEKVKAKLAALAEEDYEDLAAQFDARVSLLQLWNGLITLRPTDYVEPPPHDPAAVTDSSSQGVDATIETDAVSDPAAVLSDEDASDVAEPIRHPEEMPVPVESVRQKTVSPPPEMYGPFLPTTPAHLSDRIRLRMVKEGILMNRRLPPGTVVLVYPLDGEHLIEQGIAEILPPHFEAPDAHTEMVEF